jgi:cellulose synthase/poly-beta-1,6-N-acetylglucosamine synthase-like glycosyltransferase
VIERFGWPTAGLAEDVEFHLLLVAAGLRVRFVPDAVLRAEMPASLQGARTQNTRWEAGRLAAIRRYALPLLGRGMVRRDAVAVDAALEQLTPPLSVPVACTVISLIGGIALGAPLVWGMSAALLGFFALHLLAGLLLAGAPARVYRALLHLPLYVAWKTLLYARAMTGRQPGRWVRTEHGGPL